MARQSMPLVWSRAQLEIDVDRSISEFKERRITEPHAGYISDFEHYCVYVRNLLEDSDNLLNLSSVVRHYLLDEDKRYALRYLASPFISDDDLKVLADVKFSVAAFDSDPDAAERVAHVIRASIDPWRFPWFREGRTPTDEELRIAVVSSTAIIASSRSQTRRRSEAKDRQEGDIAQALQDAGLRKVRRRTVDTPYRAPDIGEFCMESVLGGHKADLIARLYDGRILAIEAKVSHSAVNSYKRVNHDTLAKVTGWLVQFGHTVWSPPLFFLVSSRFKIFSRHSNRACHCSGVTTSINYRTLFASRGRHRPIRDVARPKGERTALSRFSALDGDSEAITDG